jgi:hypothetical protein
VNFLKTVVLQLPDRELCILGVACTDLLQNYQIDAKAEEIVIQTDTGQRYWQVFFHKPLNVIQ